MAGLGTRRAKRRQRRGKGAVHIRPQPHIVSMDYEAMGLDWRPGVTVAYSDGRTRFLQLTDVNSDDMKVFIAEMSRRASFPPAVFDLPIR